MLQLWEKFLLVLLTVFVVQADVFAAPGSKDKNKRNFPRQSIKLPLREFELAPGVKLKMVLIKGGTFMMGSPEAELGRWHELQRKVVITRSYYMAIYETTQEQFMAVMGRNPSLYKGLQHPVENVSWNDAMEFCRRLNKLTGKTRPKNYKFTLPTEAQWEYACRAGTKTALNNNKNLTDTIQCKNLDEVAWYVANSNGHHHPVGQKKPNAWGLYDMHGNAWEYCLDFWRETPDNFDVIDPQGPPRSESNGDRVKKGGGFYLKAQRSRSAARSGQREAQYYMSFRVVLAYSPGK